MVSRPVSGRRGRQAERQIRKEGVPPRLAEVYQPGDRVEVYFTDIEEWRPGVVVALQPPAVWVRTEDGAVWFVTNGRRIRARDDDRP
jgi:hypothetical protein